MTVGHSQDIALIFSIQTVANGGQDVTRVLKRRRIPKVFCWTILNQNINEKEKSLLVLKI